MKRALTCLLLALLPASASAGNGTQEASSATVVTVRQSGNADFVGNDDVAIQAAVDRLEDGGTLLLGPGRYVMRRTIYLPKNFVLRGEEGALLALPRPVLTAELARAGTQELVLSEPGEFADRIRVQILPPVGTQFFGDGVTEMLELQQVLRVDGAKLIFLKPLELDIPAGSRVGFPHKVLQTAKEGLATIENLSFEGGRVESIPMPGHSQRCAIWAASPFGYGEERLGPPGRGVVVRHCRFTNWYGRAIALYNQEDGVVEGCLIEHISDEAIDLDHFVEHYHIVGNDVHDATWGIVLNDASRNLVEYNRVEGCEVGIFSWWYERTPRHGINEENTIRHNVVRAAREAPIHIAKTCVRYVVEHNFVEGAIICEEPDNIVRENTQL